jgi:hypothetical protein
MAVAIMFKTHGVWRLFKAFMEACLTFRSRITVRVEGFLFLPRTYEYGYLEYGYLEYGYLEYGYLEYGYLGIGTGEGELKRVS